MVESRKVGSSRFLELLIWSLSTAIAMVFACVAVLATYFSISYVGNLPSLPIWHAILSLVAFIIAGLIGGSIMGAGQWFVLQHETKVGWAGAWFRATVASCGVVAIFWWLEYQVLGGARFEISSEYIVPALVLTGVLSGAIIGAVQWQMMRPHVTVSVLWIVGSATSWLLATIAIALIATTDLPLAYLFALLAGGPIIGLATGLMQPRLIGYR